MAGFTIKVNTEQLKSKAGAVSNQISAVEKALQTIEDLISTSKGYWKGDASNTHQQKYHSLDEETRDVIKELKAHPRNLLNMAGIYAPVEPELISEINSLPGDLIS